MRVAIVEPYFGGSHKRWAEGYRDASRHDVTLITHEARFWKWRMQGAFLTLAEEAGAIIERDGPFDVVVASSMLDLAGLLGALGQARGDAAAVVYMHENQLCYPPSPRDRRDETHAMINWTSMVVADAVFFNSRFHHDVWFDGIARLLHRFPDHRHTHLIDEVERRSSVLPVGVDLARFDQPAAVGRAAAPSDLPVLLWNHRWDHDKGPDLFLDALAALVGRDQRFRLIATGEAPPIDREPLDRLASLAGDRLLHVGHVDDARYVTLVASADVVVSTSRQEFFGVSITEAVYAGAFPVLPRRLVYPERLPRRFHPICLYDSDDELVERCIWAFEHRGEAAEIAAQLEPTMACFDWSKMAPEYDERFEAMVEWPRRAR